MHRSLKLPCSALLCLGLLVPLWGCAAMEVAEPIAPAAAGSAVATYYVDSATGSDSNTGTSPDAPWKTLARLSSATLIPGTSVLLHSGSVWHEQLTIGVSGTAAAPITFGAYGGSKQPVLDGADVVGGWTKVTGNTYAAPYTAAAYKAFVDALYTPATALNAVSSLAVVESTPGSVFADGTSAYIHLADGSNPAQHTIEISGARFYNILATNRSYLQITGLTLIRAARSGFLGNATADNTQQPLANSNITLMNLTVFNWGNAAADFGPGDGGQAGIYVYGLAYHTQQPQPGWVVQQNTCGIADVQPVLTYHQACIDLEATGHAIIRNNSVAPVNAFGIAAASFYSGDPCDAPTISGNDISASQGNIRIAGCPNAIVSGNRIHNSAGYGIGIGSNGDTSWPINSTGAQLLSNTITALTISADGTLYNGVDCSNGASGGTAQGNSISQVSGSSFTLEAGTWYASGPEFPCTGWTLTANTLDASQNRSDDPAAPTRVGPLYIRDLSIAGLTLTDNLYLLSQAYPTGMVYGFTSASDYAHDMTLSQFAAVAPDSGGAAPGSH